MNMKIPKPLQGIIILSGMVIFVVFTLKYYNIQIPKFVFFFFFFLLFLFIILFSIYKLLTDSNSFNNKEPISNKENFNIKEKLIEEWKKIKGIPEKLAFTDGLYKRIYITKKDGSYECLHGFVLKKSSGLEKGRDIVLIGNDKGELLYINEVPIAEELTNPFINYTQISGSPVPSPDLNFEMKIPKYISKKEKEIEKKKRKDEDIFSDLIEVEENEF